MKSNKKMLVMFFVVISFVLSTVVFAEPKNLGDAKVSMWTTGAAADFSIVTDHKNVLVVIINTLMSLMGIIFISLMIYGGYLWMTARGNEEKVEKSKKLITAAVIGLVVVLSAYVISYFIVSSVGNSVLKN
jgi:Zn-dependent protease with chaperone function